MTETERTKEPFVREPRYVVFKLKDITAYLDDDDCRAIARIGVDIAMSRRHDGKPPFNAVVVEQDWPEFDLVWAMIEARMTGKQYALLLPPIADRFREIEQQRDEERKKHEACVTINERLLSDNRILTAQRDALLADMMLIEHATSPTHDDGAYHENAYSIAVAAIAKEAEA